MTMAASACADFPAASDALTTATYDRIASAYALRTWDNERVRARVAAFVAALPARQDSLPPRILDAGCGPGRDMLTLQREHGICAVGVDRSGGMLAEARRHVPPPARFARMDLRRLAFADQAFDGAWCSAALLHLPRAEAPGALGELARVLRPNGLLRVSLKKGTGEAVTGRETNEPRFFTYYGPNEARDLVAAAGLVVEEFTVVEPQSDRGQSCWIQILARKTVVVPPCA